MSNLLNVLPYVGTSGAPYWSLKNWLGEELDELLTLRFLRHTSDRVEAITITDNLGARTRYRIVEHNPKDIVAVSDEGDRFNMSPLDRMVVSLDYCNLSESLAAACGFDEPLLVALQPDGFFRIGKATYPNRGYVFVSFLGLEEANLSALCQLQQKGIRQANILLPTKSQATDRVLAMSEQNDWEIVLIKDNFVFSPNQGFFAKSGTRAVALSSNSPIDRWPLQRPSSPKWKDVRIRFSEDDTQRVHIQFGKRGRPFEFREIAQFTDKRNGAPNEQWTLLRSFARANGKSNRIVRGRKNPEQEKIYRCHRALSKALQAFFGLPNDPFRNTDSETSTNFDIGFKGKPQDKESGENSEDFEGIFEEMTSHRKLYKPAYDNDLY